MLFTTALNIFIRRVAANPADSVFDSGGKFHYLLEMQEYPGIFTKKDCILVFFREVLTQLKLRNFIEKDILRLSNGKAVLPC